MTWWVRAVEVLLRGAAGLFVLLAALWVVGPSGIGLTDLADVPNKLDRAARGSDTLLDWSQPPTSEVDVTDEASFQRLYASDVTGGDLDLPVQPGPLEIFLNARWEETVAYAALGAATSLGLAFVCWALAGLTRSSRAASPFTRANARRLTTVGALLLLGGPAASLGQWGVRAWMIESASYAAVLGPPSYGLVDLPWSVMGAGAVLLVIALVWRRGVTMAEDLEGLV